MLDSMKGIAILMVVMIHTGAANLPSVLGKIGAAGRTGVQIFFIVSGILTMKSYENYKLNGGGPGVWLMRKVIRLVPLYFIAIFSYTFICGGFSGWLGSEENVTIGNVITHLFFIHGLFPHYANSIIGVEWYIGTLFIYYLLTPILYKICKGIERTMCIFMISTLICTITINILCKTVIDVVDAEIYYGYFATFSPLAQFPVYMLGILIYNMIYKSLVLKNVKNKALFSGSMLIFALTILAGNILGMNQIKGITNYTLYGIVYAFIIISMYISKVVIVDNCIFNFIGKNSYGIYLIHMMVINLYEKNVKVDLNIKTWIIKYIIIFGISLVGAIIINKCIEKPISALFNKQLRNYEKIQLRKE